MVCVCVCSVWRIFLWADQPIRKYIQTGIAQEDSKTSANVTLSVTTPTKSFLVRQLGCSWIGDPRGIRRGSAGDPRGIRVRFGGSATFSRTSGPRFGGIHPRPLRPFIILKRDRRQHGAPWGLGDEGRGLALCSKILGAHVLGAIATIGKGVTKTFRGIDS